MKNCCGVDVGNICEQLDCKIKETKDGIQVDVTTKDASKTGSLKALVKACKDFCGYC